MSFPTTKSMPIVVLGLTITLLTFLTPYLSYADSGTFTPFNTQLRFPVSSNINWTFDLSGVGTWTDFYNNVLATSTVYGCVYHTWHYDEFNSGNFQDYIIAEQDTPSSSVADSFHYSSKFPGNPGKIIEQDLWLVAPNADQPTIDALCHDPNRTAPLQNAFGPLQFIDFSTSPITVEQEFMPSYLSEMIYLDLVALQFFVVLWLVFKITKR